MLSIRKLLAVSVAATAIFCCKATAAVTPGGPWFTTPLSERVVAYKINATYDAKSHELNGTETLTYTNRTGQSLNHFPFHLYLNGFQPKATWIKEAHMNGQRDFGPKKGWNQNKTGSNEIKSIKADGVDLTSQMKFVQPDDGNLDDKTVFEVQLPKPVPPNGSVTFEIAFHAKFPEVIARTGYKRHYILGGQWFPKVGVWWNGNWNCHQFHSATEFFADFGTYDVNITLPKNYNFGSTGLVTAEKNNQDGTKTVSVHAEDVHDFAWTADPTTKVVEDSVQLSTGPVKIRLLMQPGHMSSTDRYMQVLKGTMKKFDEWYGPYPYPQITVVDPPHGGSASGGMEYPMFITADTSWSMPKSLLIPELVTEHEYGHQYWYGMVATNEFEDAWLDEGINSYTEIKIMDALYGPTTSTINSRLGTAGDRSMQRMQYMSVSDLDPLMRNGWQYASNNSYGGNTYGKTATMLLTLEQIVGEQKMREAIHAYFMKYRFKHPTKADFMNTMNEATGQNLDWYWNQAIKGTETLDFRILKASSDRADWFAKPLPPEKKGKTVYDTQVIVHRKGNFIYPITLEVKFDNGETVREQWDGKDRWHRFTWQKKAKLMSAEIDPDHQVTLDLNQFDNSYRTEANTRASSKLAMYFTFITQWLAQSVAWLLA